MPLIDHNLAPSPSMRRWFGFSLTAVLIMLAWFLSHLAPVVPSLLAAGGILLGLVYYLIPASQLRIIRSWQLITFPLTFVISHLLLGTVFVCVVLPIGVMLRLGNHDPLRLNRDQRDTNWQPRDAHADVSRYFKQF